MKDALCMSLVSKQTRFLVISSSPTERTLDENGKYYGIGKAHEWFAIPVNTSTVHAVIVTGVWKDQGWGNEKGMLSIVANNGQAPDDFKEPSRDVVAYIYPAPHKWKEFQLSATVKKGYKTHGSAEQAIEEYKVWYKIGGGGGHTLHVRKVFVRLLEYADGDRT